MKKGILVKKLVSVFLSATMVLGGIPLNKTAEVNAETQVISFPVTMYDYNGKTFNQSTVTQIKSSTEYNQGNDNKKISLLQNGLYFISRSTESDNTSYGQAYDVVRDDNNNLVARSEEKTNWNVNRVGGRTGIVQSTLDANKLPQFNYKNAGLFGSTSVDGKTIYNNVGLPMTYNPETGYYNFDSKDTKVTVKGANQTMDYSSQDNKEVQFMPFGQSNFHFGLSMSVDFVKANGGKVSAEENAEDMVFNFSGDDDVWVFVDDQLVLDLGGIHPEISASLNFRTGDAVYKYKNDNLTDGGGRTETVSFIKNLADGSHTLRIFYLERGAGKSNCRISFNLLRQDKLKITKNLGEDTTTEEDFTFKVKKGTDSYINQDYKVLNSDGVQQGDIRNTGATGDVVIKAGQTAEFIGAPEIGSYTVQEVANGDYKTQWETKINSNPSGSGDGKLTSELSVSYTPGKNSADIYEFIFTNTKVTDPEIREDVVVLDYGKAVDITVTQNDDIQNTLVAVGNSNSQTDNSTALGDSYKSDSSVELKYGNVEVKDNNNLTYTLNQFMDGIDRAKYAVTSKDGDGNDKYLYGSVKMIPATTVYYEDNFAGSSPENKNGLIIFSGQATTVTDDTGNKKSTQSSENKLYGNDASYSSDSKYSFGSATEIKPVNKTETLTFTFKGTGFDIISKTDTSTGLVVLRVYKGKGTSGEQVYGKILDTVYKDGSLYQIPVFNWNTSEYGEYTVQITIGKGQTFYLDGIRLYNPINTEEKEEANNAYKDAGEAYPQIKEIRKELLASGSLDIREGAEGVVYVDTTKDTTNGVSIDEYLEKGPNNEVYLKPGQAIGFKLVLPAKPRTIQLGAKSPNGKASLSVTNNISNKSYDIDDLKTATSMYYSLGEFIGIDNNTKEVNVTKNTDGTYSVEIYITNSGNLNNKDEIVSLSNLKVTYNNEQNKEWEFKSNANTVMNTRLLALSSTGKSNNLQVKKASFVPSSAKVNRNATMTVTTNTDVTDIVILDEEGNLVEQVSSKNISLRLLKQKIFTVKIKADKVGTNNYKVYGIDKKGNISTTFKTATLRVKK